MSKTGKKELWNYFLILIGTGLIAAAIQWIYDRVGLVIGGFSGVTIIIRNLTTSLVEGGIPLWISNIVLNVPVFLYSYLRFGRNYIGKTLFGTVMLSVWLYLIPVIDLSGDDYMLAALFGGVFTGIGFGLVLRAGATTGGTDMVAALIQTRFRHYTIAQILQVLDAVVVVMGLYVFGLRPTLYAVVSVFVTTRVSDAFLEGFDSSKAAFIITERYDQVADRLMNELDRGLTGLEARGMYTKEYKCVLYCVVSRKEIVRLKDVVHEVDPAAFVIVSDVREVLGEGFVVQD
jgi:uncharacterized membrane-anchored protein YitT (DUF2179 family)